MPVPESIESFLSRVRRTPDDVRGRRRTMRLQAKIHGPGFEHWNPDTWRSHDMRVALLWLDLCLYGAWFSRALEDAGHPRVVPRLQEVDHPRGGKTTRHRIGAGHTVSYEIRISLPWLRRTFPRFADRPPGWQSPHICAYRCIDAYDGLLRILERESARIVSDLLPRIEGATPRTPEEVTELVFVTGWEAI